MGAVALPFIWHIRCQKAIPNGSTMKLQCPKKVKQCIATTWQPDSGKAISECNTTPRQNAVSFSPYGVPLTRKDPKEIPDEQKIKLLRQGKDVHIGEFGNEGSGGQSYLKYPWKAGQTYKFLMQERPDGKGNTTYTAYFYATDEKKWRLIASFLRPQTSTWYKHPHSFLENF